MKTFATVAAIAITAFIASPAAAAFTTINLDKVVNTNVAANPQTLPIGLSTGNKGTAVPFQVSASPNNAAFSGVWLAPAVSGASLTIDLTGYALSGQTSFYALLNNYYGTAGANEYDITISSATKSVTYQSIGGVDTRDYNFNPAFTTTIAATTTAWFDNGTGQRYDVRTFSLPNIFGTETLTSFKITQVNARDQAVFAGLTFSTLPAGVTAAVPEPSTWALMLVGFGAVGVAMRRRRVRASVSVA